MIAPRGHESCLGLALLCPCAALLLARYPQETPGEVQRPGGPDAANPGGKIAQLEVKVSK
jgi:hypothetical protein